jgi:hypothetical protein
MFLGKHPHLPTGKAVTRGGHAVTLDRDGVAEPGPARRPTSLRPTSSLHA